MDYKKLALGAASMVIASGILSTPAQAKEEPKQVQCSGIALKAKNDCSGNGHECSGMAKKDRDPKEWKFANSKVECEKAGGKVLEETSKK